MKAFIKHNFPRLYLYLVQIRDNNLFKKLINKLLRFNLNKNIHGVKIVKNEKGFIIDATTSNFSSISLRPKNSSDIIVKNEEQNSDPDTAIIIQGSLYNLENFVLETIKTYNKIFPSSDIFLSVWEDELKKNFINKLENKANIIINKKPNNYKFNVDLQILSTAKAIKKIKSLGKRYCLKTRTDCRIYKDNSLSFLKFLLKTFPSSDQKKTKERIISCSIDTRKYRVYGLSDILLFGNINDLEKYFIEEYYENSLKKYNFGNHPCVINETAVVNEIFLCSRYLYNINEKLNWDLPDWWKMVSKYFCVVNPYFLDFFWYKYHWQFEQRFQKNYTNQFEQSLDFTDWLQLYYNPEKRYNENFKEKWKIENNIIV